MRKAPRKKSWQIIQRHHLEYAGKGGALKDKTVKLTRTEHFFCGRIEAYARARGLTRGFCRALRYYMRKYALKALSSKLQPEKAISLNAQDKELAALNV